MVSHGVEKPEPDLENGTTGTGSTVYHSDLEKEATKKSNGGSNDPDPDHDEVEQMDEGHLDDLYRQHVNPPPTSPPSNSISSTCANYHLPRP